MRTGSTHVNAGHAAMGRSSAPTSTATPTGAAAVGGGYGGSSCTPSAAAPHPQHHQPHLGPTDTLFQLECVLLFALDVVKGPYIHSCAPVSPPDAIRSFLLAPAATPVATSSTAASAAGGLYASISAVAAVMGTPAASTVLGAARRAGQLPPPPLPPQQPPPAAPAATVAPAAVVHAASRSTLEAQSGGEVASAATPLFSGVWFPDSPATSASAALRVTHADSSSSPSFAVANGSFDAPGFPSGSLPSSSFPTPPPPPPPAPALAPSLPHSATEAASGAESVPPMPVAATPAVSSALAVSAATTEPSPPLRGASTSAGSSAAGSPLPAPVAHSGGGDGGGGGDRSSSASSLAAQLRLLDHADALDTPSEARPGSASGLNSVAAAAAAGAAVERVVFGVSALTCLSDSQQGASPLFGSFAAAAPGSTSGDGLPVEVSVSGSSTQGCGGSNVVGDAEAVLTEPFRGASASPVLTPVNTPPIGAVPLHAAAAAAAAARTGCDDVKDVSDRAARGLQHAVPLSRQQALSSSLSTVRPPSSSAAHSVPPPPQGATAAAASAATPSQPPPPPPPHAPRSSPSADDGRMSGYNDVFVPRPEFCRRVLWLYPAESGLLFLYYPEDIPGEHYQRKTLRYSLCLVFRVDQKRMTIGDGLLHQLVRPYSVVLTNIAEELREAELKYAYMSRGLRSFTSAATAASGARAVPALTLASSVSGSALEGAARRESAAGPVDSEDGVVAGDADEYGAPQAGEAAAQGTAPKPYTLVRRRAGGAPTVVETSSCSPSRPHAYHLNLVEHGGANAGAGGRLRVPIPASVMSTAESTPTSFMSPLQPTSPGRRQGLHDAAAAAVTVPASASEPSRVVGEDGDALAARSRAAKDDDGVRAAPPPAAAPSTALQGAGVCPAPAGAATAAATAALPTAPSGSTLHTTSNATAASTVAHTPVSHFGTPFSPPPVTRSRSDSRSGAAVLPELPQSSTSGTSGTSGNSGGGCAGGAAGPAAFASSPLSTDAETADTDTTPPSSLPLRSRTASHGAGLGFHAPSTSSAFSPTMGESTSTLASSSAPASALTPMTGPPNTTNSSIVITQPPPHAPVTSSNSPRPSAAAHRSPVPTAAAMVSGAGGVVSGMHTLNAFITPPTAPQWTPLGELVEALFHCLRYTGDVADAAERDGERETYNVGGSGGGGLAGFGAAGQRTPATATPTSLVTGSTDAGAWHWPDRPHGPVALGVGRPAIARTTPPSFAGSPQQPRHVSIQSIYSPLTTAVGSSFGGDAAGASTYDTRTPSWMTDGDANLGLFDGGKPRDGYGGAGPPFPSGAAPGQLLPPAPPQPPQQRGDTGIVHLSNRLSFHVRRMVPLQPARLLHFDHVPVPVVAYDPAMMGWMDMAVHHVFRLVDGVRTVADLVFDVAMGTTTTLSGVYAEALQRTLVAERSPGGGPAMATAPNTAVRGGGGGGGGSATGLVGTSRDAQLRRGGAAAAAASESVLALNNSEAAAGPGGPGLARGPPTTTAAYPSYPVVVSVPIDARPSPALLPGVRYSVPTSAAAAAAAAAISEGQAPPPSHVNVRVAPCTSPPAPPVSGASAAAAVPVPPQPPQPHISVELPPTWVATTGMVMEALLHLELCHLIKVYRPWTKSTVYSTTRAVQRVLRSAQHPARRVVAHYILCMAWTERQEARAERRRRASEWKRSQREARRQAALNAAAPGAAGAPPVRSATQKAELSQASPPSCAPSPSPPAPASTEARTPQHAAARPYYNGDTNRAGATTASASLAGLGGAASACAVERPTSHATAPLPASPQPRSLTRPVGLLSPSLSRPPHPPMGALLPGLSSAGDRGGAAGAASYGLELSSTGTHASSSAATSFAPSSLRHALSVGASGRLQMTLTSSLPTSPLLRAGANPTAAAAVPTNAAGPGSSQRLFAGSQSSQLGVGDLLPCASTGIKYTSRSPASKHPHAPPDKLRQLQKAEKPRKGRSDRQRCSEERCSSTSTSSSSSSGSGSDTGSSASSGRRSTSCVSTSSSDASTASAKSPRRRHRIRSSSSGPSVASSPSASSSDESSMPSSPASAATAQQQPQRRESVPAAQELGETSAAGAIKRGAAAANGGDSNTIVSHAACALQQGDARVQQLTASSSPALPTAATATAAAAGGPQHGAATHRRQSSPNVFAPSETDIAQAAAALLCALAKFSNSSVSSVQAEMRRIPVWAPSFNNWSNRCVDALVEVAVLNNWLEDVSQ